MTTVYAVLTDEDVLFHIFSTREKAVAWLETRDFRHYCRVQPATLDGTDAEITAHALRLAMRETE